VLLVALVGTGSFFAGFRTGQWDPDGPASAKPTDPADAAFIPAAPFAVDDAAGDARDLGLTTLGYGGQCIVLCEPWAPGAAGPEAGGFDVLGVALAEDRPDSFVLAMRLADLKTGFPSLYDTPTHRWVGEYFACWQPEGFGQRCAAASVTRHHDGALIQSGFIIEGAEACNEFGWCAWSVPMEVVYGAPGELRFTLPKEYAAFDGAPLTLEGLNARAGWWSTNKAAPLWHGAFTVHANDQHEHDHMVLLEPAQVADELEPARRTFPLGPATAPYTFPADQPLLVGGPGSISGAGSIRDYPELDVLALDYRQEGTDLVATFQFASFERMPSWDLQIAAQFMVKGGPMWDEIGIMQSNGDAYGYAGRCISNGCHDGYLKRVPLQIKGDGLVEVRVPRETWPHIQDGDVTTFNSVYTMYGEANPDVGESGAPVYGNVHSGSLVDGLSGGMPYVFGSDHVGVFHSPAHDH